VTLSQSVSAARPASFSVDPWDPSYGVAFGEELTGDPLHESTAELNLDLEVPADRWQPVAAEAREPVPASILFLDGVRRIDARVWVHGQDAQPRPTPRAWCASTAPRGSPA
jgi:hypothetical protein